MMRDIRPLPLLVSNKFCNSESTWICFDNFPNLFQFYQLKIRCKRNLLRIQQVHVLCTVWAKIAMPPYFFVDFVWVFFCLVFAMPLCASVYMCLVVTCWERADLLALVCGVLL